MLKSENAYGTLYRGCRMLRIPARIRLIQIRFTDCTQSPALADCSPFCHVSGFGKAVPHSTGAPAVGQGHFR
jgi:hypothetical protein